MNGGFTKLFSSIVTSTIWQEPHTTRIVWITMLAMADINGRVLASIPGLAHTAGVTIEECEAALKTFLNPDPYSRTKTDEGRRIKEVEGGWVLVNYASHRSKFRSVDRRDYFRQYQAQRRAKQKLLTPHKPVAQPAKNSDSQPLSTSVNPKSPIAEADTDRDKANALSRPKSPEEGSGDSKPDPNPPSALAIDFVDWFILLLHRTGGRIPELSDAITRRWAKVYDDLIRLDGHSPEEIKAVCVWARNDQFWRSNFLSPAKLRDKKDGLSYMTIFLNKMLTSKIGGQTKGKTALA